MRRLFHLFLHLGPVGLLLLGIADSSFLVLPFGNDALLALLVARDHSMAWPDVPIAALGSMLGVGLLDWVARRGGEEGLEKMIGRKRFEVMENRIKRRGAIGISIACLAPPPFPFTVVIVAASAFQYPRHRLYAVTFAARLVRFSGIAVAAIYWGRQIIAVSRSREFSWAVIAFAVGCGIASTVSVVRWIRRSRQSKSTTAR